LVKLVLILVFVLADETVIKKLKTEQEDSENGSTTPPLVQSMVVNINEGWVPNVCSALQ
jgi:hypothetical protein